jgi:acyl-CoA synthetase (AMP-forming)/AMP-acid ligase II
MMSKFSGEQAVEVLKREEISVAFLPPATLIRTMEAPGFEAGVKARECVKICAGAPLSASQKQLVVDAWPGPFYEVYGQTETASVTVLPVHATAPDKLGSVGKPLPGVDIRILDDEDHEMEVGEEGEIAVHSTTLMAGYHGQKESDSSTHWRDEHGRRFVRTGDVGRLDDEGFLWLCDRKKDMIISGGYNVFPADIEKVLSDHPAVFEVAVIGFPSHKWGETPVAIVTLQREATANAEELRDWANARLGAIQRLAAVRVVPELPSGGMGKILKRQLRAAFADAIGMLP